jgi:hypothetical protein
VKSAIFGLDQYMPSVSILSGSVSHLSSTSTVHGSVKRGKGSVTTSHRIDFRVDGKAAYYKNTVNLADGDRVTLAGKMKKGEFYARAMRNDETNVVYSEPITLYYVLGAFFLAFGVALSFILIGIILIPLAALIIWDGWKNSSAVKALQAA